MKTIEIKIDGMSCQHCVMAVEKELSKLNLESFKVEIGSVNIMFDESKVKIEDIYKAIEDAGYKIKTVYL